MNSREDGKTVRREEMILNYFFLTSYRVPGKFYQINKLPSFGGSLVKGIK